MYNISGGYFLNEEVQNGKYIRRDWSPACEALTSL